MKNITLFTVLFAGLCFAGYHKDERGSSVHTPYRWVVADATARTALSVAAADTLKLCLQMSDTTTWVLVNNSPVRWVGIVGRGVISPDSVAATKGISGTYGRFSSILWGDSLSITKGISATIGRFTGALFGTMANFTGTVSVDSLKSTKGVSGASFSTIGNIVAYTGNFNGELTAIQGVSCTNGRVWADSVYSYKRIYAPKGITTNNRDTLLYEDTTFYDSLFDNNTYLNQRAVCRITRVGRQVTFQQHAIVFTATTGFFYLRGIPAKFLPSSYVNWVVLGYADGVQKQMQLSFTSQGKLYFTNIDNNSPATGQNSIYNTVITWLIGE